MAWTGPSEQRPYKTFFPTPTHLALLLIVVMAGACGAGDPESEVAEILERDRQAHLDGDAAALAALVADPLVSVDNGRLSVLSPEDVEAGFTQYFAGLDYLGWEDQTPPDIRVFPSGTAAAVSRWVRMTRRIHEGAGASRVDSLDLAWTAIFERRNGAWQMTSVTTSSGGEAPRAPAILAGARRAVAWPDDPSQAPGAVRFEASVAWEGPPYEVEVVSSGDGRMRLRFVDGAAFGIGAESRWSRLEPDVVGPLSDTLETFARGHDFFLTLLHPAPRLASVHWAGVTRFADQRALMLTGRDAMDGVVRLYYSAADTLPLGYEVDDQLRNGGTVATFLAGWSDQQGLRLPSQVRFVQGSEVFEYTIERADVVTVAVDSLFGTPAPIRNR